MPRTGRPRKEIDWTEFTKLCQIQCTEEEIASFFDMSIETLNKRCKEEFDKTFLEVYSQKKLGGRASLRRMQWQAAESGNPTMLIWSGKQYLGQTDKQQVEHSGKGGGPLVLRLAKDDDTDQQDD